MLRTLLAKRCHEQVLKGLSAWLPSTALICDQWPLTVDPAKGVRCNCQHAPMAQFTAVSADHGMHQQWWQTKPDWSSQLATGFRSSLPAGFTGSRYFSTTIPTVFTEAAAPHRELLRSAVLAAVAKIAQQAEQQYDVRPLVGVIRAPRSAQGVFCCQMKFGPIRDKHRLTLSPLTDIQAAVAYDLVRCTVLGLEFTANLYPSMYNSGDINTMQQYLQQTQPGMFAAAVQAATTDPPPDYQTFQARKLADAAVEAAAAAVVVTEAVHSHGEHGCWKTLSGVEAYVKSVMLQPQESRRTMPGSKKTTIRHSRHYDSMSKAAVAVDMMRQALGRPAVNLPADVTAAGVPAMKAWLELDQHKLTVQKEAWQAKAAAM